MASALVLGCSAGGTRCARGVLGVMIPTWLAAAIEVVGVADAASAGAMVGVALVPLVIRGTVPASTLAGGISPTATPGPI